MAVLHLSPLALARSRFALSPLAETLGTVIALARPGPAPGSRPGTPATCRPWPPSGPPTRSPAA
ncbi:hypothetical protein O1L55_31155 [Streptomyces albulus]|nr:hypothetical protein [Streptomyces noursei]